MKTLYIIILTLVFGFKPIENSENNKFAYFLVKDAKTYEDKIKVDRYMNAQSGILMSRMDFTSHKYFIIFRLYDLLRVRPYK